MILNKILLVFIFFMSVVLNASEFIKQDAELNTLSYESYIYVDQNTPDYILSEIIKRKVGVFYLLSGKNRRWLSSKMNYFKNIKNAVLVVDSSDKIVQSNLMELASFLNYDYILFVKDDKKSDKTHLPPALALKKIRYESGDVFLNNECGVPLSVLDRGDNIEDGVIKKGLIFKKNGLAFIKVGDEENTYKNEVLYRMVVFWDSEKNIIKFIEKNYPLNKMNP